MAVLLYHVAPRGVRGGFLGVEMFFVLSGFLLTSLMLDEHARRAAIDRGAYALRRVRRIYPALVVLLATLAVVVPLVARADAHRLPGDLLSSLAGVTNWHLIADGSSYFSRLGRPSFVRHLWSVAVEMQFYVLCPFLVAWLARRRRGVAIAALVAGMAASSVAMTVLYKSPDPSRAYYGTDTRVGAILAGCLLAIVLWERGYERVRKPWVSRAGFAGLAAMVLLVAFADERARLLYPLGFLATQAATAAMIAAALGAGPLADVFDRGELRWLGKRSYGIYLWHWPAVVLALSWPLYLSAPVTIGFALVAGALSWGLVERPFLSSTATADPILRRTIAVVRAAAVAVAIVGVVVLVTRLPGTDPIAASLKRGEKVLAAQGPPPRVEEASTSSSTSPQSVPAAALSAVRTASAPRPARTAPAPGPTVPRPPAPPTPVTAVGDSVMVGAAPALHDRLGANGFIDARVGRQFDEGIKVVHDLHAEGRLGRVVIIHLGNNGPVKPQQIDQMMGELADVPNALFVTVRVDKPWQSEVNQTLIDAAHRYTTITIVDWLGYSSSHGDWFASDGTHVNSKGADAYADFVVGSIPPPPTTTTGPAPTTTSSPSTTTTAKQGPKLPVP